MAMLGYHLEWGLIYPKWVQNVGSQHGNFFHMNHDEKPRRFGYVGGSLKHVF